MASLAEIQKPLTFHIARHTFATTVTLNREANAKRGKKYQYTSDTDYIYWCIAKAKNLNFALMNLENLNNTPLHSFRGIKFSHVEDNIFKFKTDLVTTKRKIPQRILNANQDKFHIKGSSKNFIAGSEPKSSNENYNDKDYDSRW